MTRQEKEDFYVLKATEQQFKWGNPIPTDWNELDSLSDQRLAELIRDTTGQLRFERVWDAFVVVLLGMPMTLLPYVLLAWLYWLLARDASFWEALIVLAAVRAFVALIDFCYGVLAWWIFTRRVAVRELVRFLIANKFPMRKYRFDDALVYLRRLRDSKDTPTVSEETRGAASELVGGLMFVRYDKSAARRTLSTLRAALDIYAPRGKAQFQDLQSTRAETNAFPAT